MCRELIWINKRCLFYLKALTVNYHDMCLQRVSLCESSHLNSLFMSLLTLLKQAWYHTVYNSSAVRSPIVQMINVNVLINVLCMSGWSVNQDESVRREWLSGSPLAPHNLSIFPALFFFLSLDLKQHISLLDGSMEYWNTLESAWSKAAFYGQIF